MAARPPFCHLAKPTQAPTPLNEARDRELGGGWAPGLDTAGRCSVSKPVLTREAGPHGFSGATAESSQGRRRLFTPEGRGTHRYTHRD